MKSILIKIDISTYLFILFAFLAGYIKSILLIYLIVIIHEFGHFFFFKIFGIIVIKMVIYPFGGITIVDKKIHERIYKTIICSFGGIIFQIFLFFIFLFLLKYNFINDYTFSLFKTYNQTLVIFNLLPIIPLDGSKIYFAFLTKYFSFKLSYYLTLILNLIFLIFFKIIELIDFKLINIRTIIYYSIIKMWSEYSL